MTAKPSGSSTTYSEGDAVIVRCGLLKGRAATVERVTQRGAILYLRVGRESLVIRSSAVDPA